MSRVRPRSCPWCYKYSFYTQRHRDFFCNEWCELQYSEEGPKSLSEDEKNNIYSQSKADAFSSYLNGEDF